MEDRNVKSSCSQHNSKTYMKVSYKTNKPWIILPQGKATQKMKIVQDSKWRTNMRVLGALAFVLDVASECRWSHRWLIFISQVPKTHPGGKSILKPIGLEYNVPCCSTKQWLWPSVELKRKSESIAWRFNIQDDLWVCVFVLMLRRRLFSSQ